MSQVENRFKRNNYKKYESKKITKKAEYVHSEQEFPDLARPKKKDKLDFSVDSTFANIVSASNEIIEVPDSLEPGWISIRRDNNGKVVIKKNVTSNNTIYYEVEESLNEKMDKVIDEMIDNRQRYIDYYNSLHGEYSFEEKYLYPASEYEDEYDFEDNDNENNDMSAREIDDNDYDDDYY